MEEVKEMQTPDTDTNTENTENTGNTENVENPESPENPENTGNSENTENGEKTERIESIENIEDTQSDENIDSAEPVESAESGEIVERVDSAEITESTEDTETAEHEESLEDEEPAAREEKVEQEEPVEYEEPVAHVESVEYEETVEQEEPVAHEETVEPEEAAEQGEAVEDEEPLDEFSELMKDYDLKTATAYSRIQGKIIDIIDNKVIVDIGQKTEGILNKDELYDWDGSLEYDVGDTITVVCKNINTKEGYITISKRQVDREEGWQKVRRAYEKKQPLPGKIVGIIDDNKGFKVDMGVEMFLPMSQADIKKIKAPKHMLGKEYRFRVTRINSKEKNGVVSRRILLEEEKVAKIRELFDNLNVGDIVKGRITSLTDYGAFVDIGGMDGLIHKDNISYARVNHPKEKLRKGDEVEAKILDMDPKHNRISLGIKQRYPDPWIDIARKYPVGKKLIARVTKIVNFGAFIELEEGVEGLLHISDLTWEGKTESVEEFVAVGERLWVQVIELNAEERKIKLGLKQLEMRPEEKYIQKHHQREIVTGVVKKILKSRVFVELEKGVEGVVKISDITYFRIDSPHEYLKEKQKIDAMILSETLDSNYKVKLGIKHLSDNEWRQFINEKKPGSVVKVKIKKVTDKGISVEVSKDIEGFIRPNEIVDRKHELEEIQKLYKPGQEVEAMVVSSDFERKRIYFSIRALRRKKEREDIDRYSKASAEAVTTIGDLFENAIDKKNRK
jgi:small subunit ribosomal protein S1